MTRAVLAAALLTVAAAASVGVIVTGWAAPGAAPAPGHVCAAAADVRAALGASVADQVVLRARSAHLADLLIDQAGHEQGGASLARARRLVAVLDDPDATVSDLARAVEPVVQGCPVGVPAR